MIRNGKTTKKKSADKFELYAKQANLSQSLLVLVKSYILATKSHNIHTKEIDTDLKYFIDFDLVILGSPSQEYWTYARQIRQEYISYPLKEYSTGRTQVLQSFLNRANIYAVDKLNKRYGTQAKFNIKQEINKLSKN